MDLKYSIPGSIVIAGGLIAGALVLANAPARSGGPLAPPSPRVAAETAPATTKIEVRPVDANRDHIRGAADARVTLIEYSDTECPFCKRFHPTLQQAVREYDGKVRWVYRHYPLDALHQKARKEAEATECAAEQGKFWEYVDRLFEVTPSNDGLEEAKLGEIAKEVGLDPAAFETCRTSGKFAARVQEDLDDAEKAGGQGTPHTIIISPQGETIPFPGAQPYDNMKQVLDGLLG